MVESSLRGNRNRNSWWSEQWQALLYALDPGYFPSQGGGGSSGSSGGGSRGGSRRSRVQRLDVLPGSLRAQVRDRDQGICQVVVEVARLTPAQWQQVIDGLADQAIFAAQLLAGDLPVEIEQVFAEAGVSLLPASAQDLSVTCSACGDQGRWPTASADAVAPPLCPHVEQVFVQMGERLADDPWLLFQLRGMERPQILQSLRERRLSRQPQERRLPSPPVTVAGPDSGPESYAFFRLNPEAESPRWYEDRGEGLDGGADRFWGNAQQLEAIEHHISPPLIELTLLRRLGYPPFSSQSMQSYDALAQVYRRVTAQALKLAFGEDQGNGEAGGEERGGEQRG